MTQATASAFDKRLNFIAAVWQDNRWLFVLSGWLFGLLTFPLLQMIDTDWRGLLYNLVPEAVGITFTILILDRLADNRARLELQKRLVREVSSQSNETAKAAVDWLRAEGWLTTHDSIALLKGANLRNAKLQNADLSGANLQETNLENANLQGTNLENANLQANLGNANLQGANLENANLQGANLVGASLQEAYLRTANLQGAWLHHANLQTANFRIANLQGANLYSANLEGANLIEANLKKAHLASANLRKVHLMIANLEGANLIEANLQGANLQDANLHGAKNIEKAEFNEKTVLPDAQSLWDEKGKRFIVDENGNLINTKYWTPETDMTRYTNPEHPDFWKSDWWAEKQAEE